MQTWDPQSYEKNGAFVHGLAGGVLEWLAARRNERILDLGCGDGRLTAGIRTMLGAVAALGIDSSPSMIEGARSHADGNLRFDF